MSAVWRWVSLRHLFQEGGKTLLTVLGVALGVALFVGIRLANRSAMGSFAATVDAVTGKANLQVLADGAGFDEMLLPRIRAVPGVRAAAPVLEIYAAGGRERPVTQRAFMKGERSPYGETLLVMGVDFLAEEPFQRFEPPSAETIAGGAIFMFDPTAAAITRSLANRERLALGDPLVLLSAGQPVRLTVRMILDTPELQQAFGGNLVVMLLPAAQSAFHREGKLDRVDLVVDPQARDRVTAELRRRLPEQVRVGLPQERTTQVESMVSAFELNLTALSFIALLVSMFLIFNAVWMSVLRRRKEIGILRALGQERRQVLAQILQEALGIGVVGSVAGLGVGTLLAQLSLGAVARTLNTLYVAIHARHLILDSWTYLAGFVLGVGAAVVSAVPPALEAAGTHPSLTVRQGTFIEARPMRVGRWTAGGLGTLLLAAAVTLWTVQRHRPYGGFASAALVVGAFALLAPAFTLGVERLVQPLVRRLAGIEGALGARYLRDSVARTSVVAAALMVAVGMTVGLSIMVGSFRQTVDVWVGQTLRGDLYVEPVGRDASGVATALPEDLVRAFGRLPGVAAIDTSRGVPITYHDRITFVGALDFAVQERYGRLQFVHGTTAKAMRAARVRDGAVVSESFAFHHHVREGDTVALSTPSGPARLIVCGIYYDYSTDTGTLMVDRGLYERLWRDRRTERVALYLQPGASVEDVRKRLLEVVAGRVLLYATPNQQLRERVMHIFDQTFQITYALQAIAVFVSVLGVVSTLTALILQRGREIGVLRAVGALRRQVQKMVLVESALVGLIGAVMGCLAGFLLALLLTYVINKQFFGWSVRFSVDPWVFVQAVVLMVGASTLAGLGPARLAATRVAAEAMRME